MMMTQHVGHRASDEVAQKAEQAGSGWAKTLGFPFGEEMVRRWNAYETLVNTCARLSDDYARLQVERQNCPPASESEYVRRLEDEIGQLSWALAIMWHAYEGGHRPPAKVIAMAEKCYREGKKLEPKNANEGDE